MKIAGIDPKTLSNEVILVLPRGESEIIFRAKGLPDMGEFEALCPAPKPPGKFTKDGWIPNLTDPTYQQVLGEWAKKRLGGGGGGGLGRRPGGGGGGRGGG